MINWFDMPAEGLSNGGLFEVKELEVTENGTYETKGEMYNKVTVNVEGGGGSSDFSTAEVTVTYISDYRPVLRMAFATEMPMPDNTTMKICGSFVQNSGNYNAVLYGGNSGVGFDSDELEDSNVTVSGNIQKMAELTYLITGDCTITIS